MKLTKFESNRIDAIAREINDALRPIAEKYGLKDLKLGRISYSDAEFKTSMCVKIASEDSQAAKDRMARLSKAIGFTENIMGREVYNNKGERCRVVDINTRKSKYPIIAEVISDPSRRILFSEHTKFVGEQPKKIIDQFHNLPGTRIERF